MRTGRKIRTRTRRTPAFAWKAARRRARALCRFCGRAFETSCTSRRHGRLCLDCEQVGVR